MPRARLDTALDVSLNLKESSYYIWDIGCCGGPSLPVLDSCASTNTCPISPRILGLSHLHCTKYILFLPEFTVWGFKGQGYWFYDFVTVCVSVSWFGFFWWVCKRLELSEFVTIWLHRVKESQINASVWNQVTKVPRTAQTSLETQANWKPRQKTYKWCPSH